MPKPTRFIVFEGLDGAGTTTQAAMLQALFTRSGTRSFATREPTSGPVGAFIRRLLTGEEKTADGSAFRPAEEVMGLLFAADRLAHSRIIDEHRRRGEHVVCDRYIFSSMAYQTLDPQIGAQWVIDVNRGCAVPDITFMLAVPVDVCLERVAARNDGKTIYENRDHLETIARNYEALLPLYAKNFGTVIRLDGTMTADEVHFAVLDALDSI